MAINVGINGFGRIGRLVFRRMLQTGGYNVVLINDITDAKTLAYLLKYDSVHGVLAATVTSDADGIIVDGKKYKVMAEKDPSKLPWKSLGADIVIEGTGIFTSREKLQMHITAGAKKVILTAPAKGRNRRHSGSGRERQCPDRQGGFPLQCLVHDELPRADGEGAP